MTPKAKCSFSRSNSKKCSKDAWLAICIMPEAEKSEAERLVAPPLARPGAGAVAIHVAKVANVAPHAKCQLTMAAAATIKKSARLQDEILFA